MTSVEPKTSNIGSVPDNSSYTSRAKNQGRDHPAVQGVKILGFSAKSSAKESGMQKGDGIIAYDGVGNLTTEKLLALTAMTKPEGSIIHVVLVRNGNEYSLTVPPGPLGISAMDTMAQGSSGLRTGEQHVSDQKPDPIPVLQIIREAIVIPWHKRATMFRALLPISVVLITVSMIASLMREELGPMSVLIWTVIFVPVSAILAITCHRFILLGDESVPKYGLASWSSRETRFVGWTLGAALCAGLIGFIVSIPASILMMALLVKSQTPPEPWIISAGIMLVMIPSSYTFARLSVLLPATAVDERPSLTWARRLTKGNGWRLFLVVGVLPQALWLGPRLLLGHSVIADLSIYAAGCVLSVIQIAALSLSYQHLTGRNSYHADN